MSPKATPEQSSYQSNKVHDQVGIVDIDIIPTNHEDSIEFPAWCFVLGVQAPVEKYQLPLSSMSVGPGKKRYDAGRHIGLPVPLSQEVIDAIPEDKLIAAEAKYKGKVQTAKMMYQRELRKLYEEHTS